MLGIHFTTSCVPDANSLSDSPAISTEQKGETGDGTVKSVARREPKANNIPPITYLSSPPSPTKSLPRIRIHNGVLPSFDSLGFSLLFFASGLDSRAIPIDYSPNAIILLQEYRYLNSSCVLQLVSLFVCLPLHRHVQVLRSTFCISQIEQVLNFWRTMENFAENWRTLRRVVMS